MTPEQAAEVIVLAKDVVVILFVIALAVIIKLLVQKS